MKVITYNTPRGRKINLTQPQVRALEENGTWPRSVSGEEYCQVSHGLHEGLPTAEGSTDVSAILRAAQ